MCVCVCAVRNVCRAHYNVCAANYDATGVYKFMFAYVYNIMYATTIVVVGYTLVGTHLCVYAPARTSVQFIRWHEYCLQSDSFNLCVLDGV